MFISEKLRLDDYFAFLIRGFCLSGGERGDELTTSRCSNPKHTTSNRVAVAGTGPTLVCAPASVTVGGIVADTVCFPVACGSAPGAMPVQGCGCKCGEEESESGVNAHFDSHRVRGSEMIWRGCLLCAFL